MKASFRTKVFLAASGAGLVTALATAGLLFWSLRQQMHGRIEERVLLEARLVADQLERDQTPAPPGRLRGERPSGSRRSSRRGSPSSQPTGGCSAIRG